MDESVISQGVKSNLRGNLESSQRELVALKNKQMVAMVDAAIQAVKQVTRHAPLIQWRVLRAITVSRRPL